MLLALTSLVRALAPVEASPVLHTVLQGLASAPVLALALGALLTWACHSSVAIVLLIVSLAASGVAGPGLSLALVLGANVGGALAPVLTADSPTARRIPVGNLIIRAVGCLLALPFVTPIAEGLRDFAADVETSEARALYAVQGRGADALPNTKTTTAAWRVKPTWYQVSTEDRTMNPELERFLAKRMKATTIELNSSHVSLVSHPKEIADLILRAAGYKN
jgi:pimeloyl-ACP methyl ester carboxylesterase